MGKFGDAVNWFGEKAKKLADTFGTGVEALNPKRIADTVSKK